MKYLFIIQNNAGPFFRFGAVGLRSLDAVPELLKEQTSIEHLTTFGFEQRVLSTEQIAALASCAASTSQQPAWHHLTPLLAPPSITLTLLDTAAPHDADPQSRAEYLKTRINLIFDLVNEGALSCRDTWARELLLSSFAVLPSYFLTDAGDFIANGPPPFRRTERPAAPAHSPVGGIDKFPSLLAVRGQRLAADQNRIVPSAMIRDGVHVGKRNIFMFHAAVNIGAAIGDDNLIDSHASVGSSAWIGNRNKLGSFVSIEGVLSPANAEPVELGDDNFLGTAVRIGTGIKVGNNNFFGAGISLALGTPLRDCRRESTLRGEYCTVRALGDGFSNLAILPNNSHRTVHGVDAVPGELLLHDNDQEFMDRFKADQRIKPIIQP